MRTLITSRQYNLVSKATEETHKKYRFPGVKVGLVIPAYNEEKNIGQLLEQIPTDISDLLTIIVVNDGSKDDTAKIAESYNCIVLNHEKNRGYGAAVRTGFNFCSHNDFDVIILLDADCQHDPTFIPNFIQPIVNHQADFVIGNRYNLGYEMGTIKRLATTAVSIIYTILLRKKISDPTQGYRALSSKVIKNLSLLSDYSISQEMLLKIIPYYKFKEINTKVRERANGKSFINLKKYFLKTSLVLFRFYLIPKVYTLIDAVDPKHELIRKLKVFIKT